MDETWFAFAINVPALVFLGLVLLGSAPGEWGRGALVIYAGLLITLLSARIGSGLGSPWLVILALGLAFAASAISGRMGLLVACLSLAALAGIAWMVDARSSMTAAAIAAAIVAAAALAGIRRRR
jgi:hypothetical protein